jgi:hypothetical protein
MDSYDRVVSKRRQYLLTTPPRFAGALGGFW